ncbi:hypothetical protein [Streptomyces sp. SID14515]|uniref:hypothetical protein n=1 Tax=Streptomyces sp. SID14515 TaxID=2706074 RepID=UPI0013C8DF00|nr:hypothetical protein [Streptomyces sp. SID14515]NEB36303.1 hypothetical protein [Streptomyces sp. SID14515]
MRIWRASAAAAFCTAALATTVGTAGAVPFADAPAAGQGSGKPACGSVESFLLGAPYSGTINRGGHDYPVQLTPGAEKERLGRISTGPVTGPATLPDGRQATIDSHWTAEDDLLTKALANYRLRMSDGEKVGKVTCDAETGAVSQLVAHDIDATFIGGEAHNPCETGDCGGATGGIVFTDEQIKREVVGTLSLTGGHTAS